TGNILDSCNQRSAQQCMKSGVAKHLEDTTRSTYLVNRSPSSTIGFKKFIDMLGFFRWLARIKQRVLEPVKVKCIFVGYHKSIVVACEVISKWKAGLKEDINVRSYVYLLSNGCRKSGKGNVLGLEIIRDQSGNTLRVSQSRIHNEKLVQTLLKGHSTLSLEDSLSGDCDLEARSIRWSARPDIASVGVDMLNGFDRGLQTHVHVFVDFDYAMERSITVMSRSITGYGLILGCAGSLKARLQHMEGYELRLVAGIATGALIKGCSLSEVPAQVKVVVYRVCHITAQIEHSKLLMEIPNVTADILKLEATPQEEVQVLKCVRTKLSSKSKKKRFE
nr:zinc finger, CCHC-type [Tanacetum cinerariifolium]